MPCEVDRRGRPKCHITHHPNRPQEKFCATCNQRFAESEGWEILWVLIAILFTFILASANQIQQSSYPEKGFREFNSPR